MPYGRISENPFPELLQDGWLMLSSSPVILRTVPYGRVSTVVDELSGAQRNYRSHRPQEGGARSQPRPSDTCNLTGHGGDSLRDGGRTCPYMCMLKKQHRNRWTLVAM